MLRLLLLFLCLVRHPVSCANCPQLCSCERGDHITCEGREVDHIPKELSPGCCKLICVYLHPRQCSLRSRRTPCNQAD
ncbi:hypothetical protein scyTo_0010464 [Scyliorhinus torazame]|uniref:IGFBP N-terminal domain-containing protein n=1 Tax=Scyliorhinus torazame TaxID=75743 RepID=A0A401P6Y8_SCYTO|nr:hypothetical protein [Scyliorhinus torazame]